MNNIKIWFVVIVLIILAAMIGTTTCSKKEKIKEEHLTATPAAESKVEAIPLAQNEIAKNDSRFPSEDPWYKQISQNNRKKESGDEENPKGVISFQ